MNSMGRKIKVFRALGGVTQFDLSQKSGINRSKLSFIECGYIKPKPEEQKRIAKALGCTPDKLFSEEAGGV